ncbi:MAG: hypothetical protein FWD94_08085 [Treponema sp.]|nr:hypothetical protein [Treponema sp.]
MTNAGFEKPRSGGEARKSILKEESRPELHGVHGVSSRVLGYGFHDVLGVKITRLKRIERRKAPFSSPSVQLQGQSAAGGLVRPPWLKNLRVFLKIDFRGGEGTPPPIS